ncbi:MAG: hypothetical protein WCL42_05965 [Chlorobiaceae bacterium]
MLRLSSLGDGFFLPPKLLLTHTADQIETMRHLPFEPVKIRGIAFDGELAAEGGRMIGQLFAAGELAHPAPDETF